MKEGMNPFDELSQCFSFAPKQSGVRSPPNRRKGLGAFVLAYRDIYGTEAANMRRIGHGIS